MISAFIMWHLLFVVIQISTVDRDMMTILAAVCWMLLMSLNATNMLRTCHNPIYRKQFFYGFEKLKDIGGTHTNPKRLHSYCITVNIVFIVIFLINVGLLNYGMFFTHSFDIVLTNLIDDKTDDQTVLIVKSINIIVTIYMSALWLFPISLEMVIGFLLYQEFKMFGHSLVAKVRNGQYFMSTFEVERQRFFEMSKIVTAADKCLAIHHGAVFACNIGIICLMLYILAYLSQSTDAVSATIIFWLVTCVLDMAVVCVVGILVNSEVRTVKN